jgi:hypothetical protein
VKLKGSGLQLDLEKTKNLAEVIGKLTLGYLAVAYVLGLFVNNVYLNKFNVTSYSLFRLSYITAGIWASLPILLALTLFGVSDLIVYLIILKIGRWWHGLQYRGEENQPEFEFPADAFTVLSMVVPAGISYLIYRAVGGATNRDLKVVLLVVIVVIMVSAVTLLGVTVSTDRTHLRRMILIILPLLSVLVLIICTTLFGYDLYERIPAYLGGGKPQKVQLLVRNTESQALLKEVGVEFQKDSHLTSNVELLFVGDDELILLTKVELDDRKKALSVKRDSVQAILPDRTYEMLGR